MNFSVRNFGERKTMATRTKSIPIKVEAKQQHGTQSLERAFAVLNAVASGCREPQSIGHFVGTTRSTTHRLVSYLHRAGFVRHIEGRGYVLGARLVELGSKALAQMPLITVAHPLIEKLANETGDAVHLSLRDGDRIIYVDKIPGTKSFEMRSAIGTRKPLAITGTGKAIMLDLPEQEWARLYKLAKIEIGLEKVNPPGFLAWSNYLADMRTYRDRGYTMEKEENQASIVCVGAPIRDARGIIVAGLSIASAAQFMPPQRMLRLAPAVQACAAEISRGLGFEFNNPQPD